MKETKNKFSSYKRGVITIQAQSLHTERFINLLWNKGIYIKNIKKIDITTVNMDIPLCDFSEVEAIAKRTSTKIKIIKRQGISFLILRLKKQFTLAGGIVIFAGFIYYLSTFIWGIDIKSDKHLSPYEIRMQLKAVGIQAGISKRKLDVYQIEEDLIKNNENIMWAKARTEGSKLKITVTERHTPPTFQKEEETSNIVAKADGQIIRIYTLSGTPVVNPGDVVKKGQLLIKGQQGKEGSEYEVPAKGEVIAKTYYEFIESVELKGKRRIRTGNKVEGKYFEVFGKKIYIYKPSLNFNIYDKIEESGRLIKKSIYYEIKEEAFEEDEKIILDQVLSKYEEYMKRNLDQKSEIIDRVVNKEYIDNNIKVRIVFVVKENIAAKVKVE